jgi:hypothetical protein
MKTGKNISHVPHIRTSRLNSTRSGPDAATKWTRMFGRPTKYFYAWNERAGARLAQGFQNGTARRGSETEDSLRDSASTVGVENATFADADFEHCGFLRKNSPHFWKPGGRIVKTSLPVD